MARKFNISLLAFRERSILIVPIIIVLRLISLETPSDSMSRDPARPSSSNPSASSLSASKAPASSNGQIDASSDGMDKGNPSLDTTSSVETSVSERNSLVRGTTPSADSNGSAAVTNTIPANRDASYTQTNPRRPQRNGSQSPPGVLLLFIALGLMLLGFVADVYWLGIVGSVVALLLSARIFWTSVKPFVTELITPAQWALTAAIVGGVIALIGLFQLTGINRRIGQWLTIESWDGVGAIGDLIGAIGQILIAILAVYIAWRQYVISKDLTIQQNLITQQQTIDSYFQGISDLVLDAEGLLEDWPQERAIAEGRTAAILSSVDPTGKAKIVRFLSRSRLLTPLKRDRHLGRAMLDGMGGYQEDRDFGIRVIDLGVMLAAANLARTDLRWTDLSDTNMVRANLERCDLVKSNLARSILYETNLRGADLMGTRLFYGTLDTATPRTRTDVPDYNTGACTGAVVENADFTGVQRLSEQQRHYVCAWGGEKTRSTVPGGCGDVPNQLGR